MPVVTFNVDLTPDVSLIIITVPVSVLMDILETHSIQGKAVNKSLDVKIKMIVLKCMLHRNEFGLVLPRHVFKITQGGGMVCVITWFGLGRDSFFLILFPSVIDLDENILANI